MLPASEGRDSVKYLDRGFRDLVERRHQLPSDERDSEDFGDMLIASRQA
jgi:hypothetical protein